MRGHVAIALRIVCMTCALLGISGLYRLTLAQATPITVFDTVYAQCILILVSLLYYGVGKFVYAACFPPKHRPRRISLVPRDADGNYIDVELTTVTEVVMGSPKLTIPNVWVLVYGAGFVLFVSGYCILGLDHFCLAAFGFGLSTLCVDELVCPRHSMNKLYLSARCSTLLAAGISIVLVTIELLQHTFPQLVATLDLYSLIFGVALPVLAQFVMVAIRDCRHYTLGSVIEVCEFGLPFTSFLGVFHLSVAYGQRFQMTEEESAQGLNQTWFKDGYAVHVRTDGPFITFYGLGPFLIIPSVVAYVSCALEGSSIDPLLTVALTLCTHYLVSWPASTLGIYGTVCCAVAITIRVLAEYTPAYRAGPLAPQGDDSLLPHHVVWQRSPAEVRELARNLAPVPEDVDS
jgi:hypothetical protein